MAGRRLGDPGPCDAVPGGRTGAGRIRARPRLREDRLMDVLKALADEIRKMFAADLWLSLAAVATGALVAAGLRGGVVPSPGGPFILGAGGMVALATGVIRGAR